MAATYIYRISTAPLSALYLSSEFLCFTKKDFVQKVQADLGYHATHLIPLMILAKILGPAAILARVSAPPSDLAGAR